VTYRAPTVVPVLRVSGWPNNHSDRHEHRQDQHRVFPSSPKLFYTMQKLAAAYVGVNLNYPASTQASSATGTRPSTQTVGIRPWGTVKHLLELAHDARK
jgi:hypothetical protein